MFKNGKPTELIHISLSNSKNWISKYQKNKNIIWYILFVWQLLINKFWQSINVESKTKVLDTLVPLDSQYHLLHHSQQLVVPNYLFNIKIKSYLSLASTIKLEHAVALLYPHQIRFTCHNSILCFFRCHAPIVKRLFNHFLLISSVDVYLEHLLKYWEFGIDRQDHFV